MWGKVYLAKEKVGDRPLKTSSGFGGLHIIPVDLPKQNSKKEPKGKRFPHIE
jgi:hypothetical protein